MSSALWRFNCLNRQLWSLSPLFIPDLCVWFLAEDQTSNSCGMWLSRERAFGEDAFESRSSFLSYGTICLCMKCSLVFSPVLTIASRCCPVSKSILGGSRDGSLRVVG
ncbi:unnamed protein product [Brassica napus]|uniref:(rape) hypothetical protein n=1 Tax=Brassica napus TaxID=3708 RepID=A0A816TUL2_BRANA|nr:unnamed protein product [Brassica napus]